MEDMVKVHNDVVNVDCSQEQEIVWMKAKIEDLEDRSRRNNVKIRGIPASLVYSPIRKEINSPTSA